MAEETIEFPKLKAKGYKKMGSLTRPISPVSYLVVVMKNIALRKDAVLVESAKPPIRLSQAV